MAIIELSTGINLINMSKKQISEMIIAAHTHSVDEQTKKVYDEFSGCLQDLCKQSYQLVTWMWLQETTVLEGKDAEKEKNLKEKFYQTLRQVYDHQCQGHDDSGEMLKEILIKEHESNEELTIREFYNKINSSVYQFKKEVFGNINLRLNVHLTSQDDDKFDPLHVSKFKFDQSKDELIVELCYPKSRDADELNGKFKNLTDDDIKNWIKDSSDYLPDEPFPQDVYLGGF